VSAIYIPNFMDTVTSDEMFHNLWNDLNWERRSDAPRREYWTNVFDRPYSYGRGAGLRTYEAQPSTTDIRLCNIMIRNELVRQNMASDDDKLMFFEGCFLNGYEGAKDWLGWHEDDDQGIDHTKPIAIVTLYGGLGVDTPRSIQFREKLGEIDGKMTHGLVEDLPLAHGSLCLMPAGFQSTHQHRIPKAGFNAKSRISLTFRSLLS
jgi:alkylated DNA repair dioxygenase AlkB